MSRDTNRNRLLTFLLVNRRASIQEISADLGSRAEVLEAVKAISRMFPRELSISIISDTEEILMLVNDSRTLYEKIGKNASHDFNDTSARVAYLLNKLISDGSFLNIDDLAEEMMVSRSTVNNDLRKCKEVLSKYNAQIKGIPNKGVYFVGGEFEKRLVMIYEVFDYTPLKSTVNEKVIELVDDVSLYYGLNDFSTLLLYKATLVEIDRVMHGGFIDSAIAMYKNFERGNEVIEDYVRQLESLFGISLKEKEIDFITFPINTRNSAYTDSVDNTENEDILTSIVHQMVLNVKRRFMINVNENEFFNRVRYHLLFLINRLIFRIPSRDIFSDQIKLRFPLAFELARISMNVIQENYSLPSTKVDISYLAVYYALILDERKILRESISERKVAVVTNLGRGSFELIRRQLQEIVGPNTTIDNLTVKELKKRDVSGYSILFTTENIFNEVQVPVINIGGNLDSGSLIKKINEIEEKAEDPFHSISRLTDVSITYLDGNKSYQENVRTIAETLASRGEADKNVFQMFLDKEQVSSMIYDNGVAFPHLTDKVAKTLSLTLGFLMPSDGKLKLIFFLLIPEELDQKEEDKLMKLYDQIFSIISDGQLVRKLLSTGRDDTQSGSGLRGE